MPQGIRKNYQDARRQAGSGFIKKNPGKHVFFKVAATKICVFCGRSEESARHGDEKGALDPCGGDLRSEQVSAHVTKRAAEKPVEG